VKNALLMVAWLYAPAGGSSGVLRPLKFSKYLPARGWIPHILTVRESLYRHIDHSLLGDIPADASLHRTLAVDFGRHLAVRGRHLVPFALPDRYIGWLPFAVARGLRVIRRHGITALYSTSPTPTAHLVAAALKALSKVPWVADFRDPWVEEPGSSLAARPWRHRIQGSLERLVVRSADRLTVTTPDLRADFLSRYPDLPPDKVQVIYNGYDEEDFAGLGPASRPDRFEIMHAGLVDREFRNPFPLFDTVSSLIGEGQLLREHVRITFLGISSWLRSPEFAARVKHLGLEDVVQLVPRVSHGEALRRLGRSAVLLLLQASDDTRSLIPAKAFEYLRLGRPILALTLNGATAHLLKDMDQCHVLDPADQFGLRNAVLHLYRSWQLSPDGCQVSRPVQRYARQQLTGELSRLLDGLAGIPRLGGT